MNAQTKITKSDTMPPSKTVAAAPAPQASSANTGRPLTETSLDVLRKSGKYD